MNYPTWAPADLIEVWERRNEPEDFTPQIAPYAVVEGNEGVAAVCIKVPIINDAIRPQAIALLERFLTDERMRTVWHRLARLDKKRGSFDRSAVSVYFMAQGGIAGWIGRPKDTPAQKREKLQTIQKMATDLAHAMQASYYLDTVDLEMLLNDDDVLEVAHVAGAEIPSDDDAVIDLVEVWRLGAISAMPRMGELVTRLALLAENEAQRPEYVKQPGDPDAPVHHFVRQMAEYFGRVYGTSMYGTIATIANVALGVEINAQRVRQLVKDSPARLGNDRPQYPPCFDREAAR